MLDEWVDELIEALAVEDDTDVDELLEVARVVAHNVERRAAPVTTYLMGLAVARRGGETALRDVSNEVMALAQSWEGAS